MRAVALVEIPSLESAIMSGELLLPTLVPLDGVTLRSVLDLLTPEELARVRQELAELARNRREAYTSAGSRSIG